MQSVWREVSPRGPSPRHLSLPSRLFRQGTKVRAFGSPWRRRRGRYRSACRHDTCRHYPGKRSRQGYCLLGYSHRGLGRRHFGRWSAATPQWGVSLRTGMSAQIGQVRFEGCPRLPRIEEWLMVHPARGCRRRPGFFSLHRAVAFLFPCLRRQDQPYPHLTAVAFFPQRYAIRKQEQGGQT